jgi:hypothetical protein
MKTMEDKSDRPGGSGGASRGKNRRPSKAWGSHHIRSHRRHRHRWVPSSLLSLAPPFCSRPTSSAPPQELSLRTAIWDGAHMCGGPPLPGARTHAWRLMGAQACAVAGGAATGTGEASRRAQWPSQARRRRHRKEEEDQGQVRSFFEHECEISKNVPLLQHRGQINI